MHATTDARPPAPWRADVTDLTAGAVSGAAAFALAVAGGGAVLWSVSGVGTGVDAAVWALLLLGAAGLWFVIALLLAVVDLRRSRPTAAVWWLVGSVAVGVLTVALVWLDVPWSARWGHARPAFAAVVEEEADPDLPRTEERQLGGARRLGTIDVLDVRQQGEAVLFTTDGGFFEEVGLAYLPEGPFPGLGGAGSLAPTFTPIGGDWYRWSQTLD